MAEAAAVRARELLGCALVFAAVICVQLPDKKKAKQVETA